LKALVSFIFYSTADAARTEAREALLAPASTDTGTAEPSHTQGTSPAQ